MLTRINIKNFKGIPDADINLSRNVVFIGPNNSGKTSALQALALWDIGLKSWLTKRSRDQKDLKRPGVTINRRDLIALSVPSALFLWSDLHVREAVKSNPKQRTENVLIQILVEGVYRDKTWKCGFEFDYANPESFYCRPLRLGNDVNKRMPLPDAPVLDEIKIAYLPPMSGLAAVEPKLESGRVNVLIGEGQTAQVLRNICYAVSAKTEVWDAVIEQIKNLFGVSINPPVYIPARGEVTMSYKDKNGLELDLSSSGRGFQQTLLIMAFMYANPNTVILLDEPDAHLEILRQRQTYQIITEIAAKQNSQLICASHSEVVLNEAAEKDTVIAFIGKPHIINDKGSQLIKSLREIGFEDYYLAEEKKWILYLEGSTDLSILRTLANSLNHPAQKFLDSPFIKFLGTNIPRDAEKHFYGLREAVPELKGVALFDRLNSPLDATGHLIKMMWKKREIENYICRKDAILAWIRGEEGDDLFDQAESTHRVRTMEKCIEELENALEITGKPSPWSDDLKVTDEFLNPLFDLFHKKLNLPEHSYRKRSYYELANYLSVNDIDPEVTEKLNQIYDVAMAATKKEI